MNAFYEAMKQLPELVKLIQSLAGSTLGVIALAVFLLLYVFNKIPQLELIQSHNKKREERAKALEEYLKSDKGDKSVLEVVQDQRDAQYFEMVTGIHAEKKWREGLVDLHNRSDARWLEMKRAWRYMEFGSDGKLLIREFKKWEKFELWYNNFMAGVLIICAAVAFVVATSNAHLLVTPTEEPGNSALVQAVGTASSPHPGGAAAPGQTTGTPASTQAVATTPALKASDTTAVPVGQTTAATPAPKPVAAVLLLLVFSVVLFGVGIWAAAQNLPMKAAKNIRRGATKAKTVADNADGASGTGTANGAVLASPGPATPAAAAPAPSAAAGPVGGAGAAGGTNASEGSAKVS